MPIAITRSEAVVSGADTVALSQFVNITAGGSRPAYLVVVALDRNEYTVAADGSTGSFSGNGATLGLSSIGGDGRGAGIVFTWQASSGQYVNTTYGALSNLSYTASGSASDMTDISLFGASTAQIANTYCNNAYSLMQQDAGGYLGTISVCTQSGFGGPVPTAATPSGVAAAAMNFVGQAWNENGCWVLASTIAAEAGAALPVQSAAIGVKGVANGEWVVVYNGPAGGTGTWQNLVTMGDIVVFGSAGGGGHITTCVSGTGSTAMLVDNITYVDSHGHITNPANDGSALDVAISAPHAAAQEWAGVAARSVVIYALDTPVVACPTTTRLLADGHTLSLSTQFTVSDPGHRAITSWQVYESDSSDNLLVKAAVQSAFSADSAVTLANLSQLSLQGLNDGTDLISVRAFNGLYWGDWQTLTVNVNPASALSPVLSTQTPDQTWVQGTKVAMILPKALFTDPQKEALRYTATLAGGGKLPSWLSFNTSTLTFSATVPKVAQTLQVVVTATNTDGLTGTDTFALTVAAPSNGMLLADWSGAPHTAGLPAVAGGLAASGGWMHHGVFEPELPFAAALHHFQ